MLAGYICFSWKPKIMSLLEKSNSLFVLVLIFMDGSSQNILVG